MQEEYELWPLFSGEGDFVNKLLIVNRFYLHVHAIRLRISLVLTNSESLSSFGRTLVDDIEFNGWMLFKEVAEDKFSLSLAIGLRAVVQGYVHRLVEVAHKFFSASCLNRFLHLGNNVALRK